MIRYNYKVSDALLEEYDKIITPIVKSKLRSLISKAPISVKERLNNLFTDDFIESLLKCNPDKLTYYISEIYNSFPELSDLYYPAHNLSSIKLTQSHLEVPATKSKEVYYEKLRVSTAYDLLRNNPNSIFSRFLSNKLWSAVGRKESKATLKFVLKYKEGSAISSDLISNNPSLLAPDWVRDFETCFDYTKFRDTLGNDFILDLDIDICLYCNKEEIQTIISGDSVYKADLDHFHPKSKFPFLALTLSNLIPSGEKCNQRFKGAKVMLNCSHPYLEGVGSDPLFKIEEPLTGGKLNKNNFTIYTESQFPELDRNIELFKIESVYNQNLQLRSWVVATTSKKDFFRSLGRNIEDELKKPDNMIYVDLSDKSHKVYAKKFKIDFINQISFSDIKFS